MPWFTDDITEHERWTLDALYNIATTDAELANMLASTPWFTNDITEQELRALNQLDHIATTDAELAKIVANLPWFTDDITEDERWTLGALYNIATTDAELANMLTSTPWFTNDITEHELRALNQLDHIATTDAELAKIVANLPWFTDGATEEDSLALKGLFFVAATDVELATMVTVLPWFTDGVTEGEGRALNAIGHIAGIDRDLASELAASVKDPTRDLDIHAIEALGGIASHGTDALDRLTSQPWYVDGLSDEEYALVVVLNGALRQSSSMYDDLLRTHFIQTETVLLSLARDVNIYVIQNTPFSSYEDLPREIKESARAIENFVREPFPTTDIILHVVVDSGYRVHGMHLYNYMQLVRAWGRVWFIPHETAHYYFYSDAGPVWYVEGIANFLDAHVNEQIGVPIYSERRAESATTVRSACRYNDEPIENIRHYNYILERVHAGDWFSLNREDKFWLCVYPMGDNLLFAVHDAIGEDAMSAAVRELYLQNLDSGQPAGEEDIYRAFLKHAPSDKKEAFLDVYRRLHGGAFAFDDAAFDDDHGDQAALATEIAVGETAEGVLDYMFDFDYFKFRAEGGQRYRINVVHPSLRTSSVTMYSRDGTTRLGRRADTPESSAEVASGVRILWSARRDGMYHVAVQNFGGKTGSYTLTITPDDEGD